MVRFKQRLDSAGKIYIPKVLRDAGFAPLIEIAPNSRAAVIYPYGADLEEVLNSLRIIRQDLEHSAKLSSKKKSAG